MTEEISGVIFGVWFLIGAALVFWMQAGFAMVEAGFTRAKNTGNILMKNLMDFCIGTVVFILIGFSLLLGEDVATDWYAILKHFKAGESMPACALFLEDVRYDA